MTGYYLDDKVAVSPQITVADVATLKEAGFSTIICNRPDLEVTPDLTASTIAKAAEDQGIRFVDNPMAPGMLSMNLIAAQLEAFDVSEGPALAYCASGTRSAYLWAFAMALGHQRETTDILAVLADAGYPAPGIATQLDQIRDMGH